MTIKIVIADDHVVVREGLRLLLERQQDIGIVGETANGRDAVRHAADLKPDIIVMDIAMPELNGIEATGQILERSPSTRVIILSMHSTPEHIRQAFKAGAHGYLLKENTGVELINAVRAVHGGRRYVSQKISDILIGNYLDRRDESDSVDPFERLSLREREVLQLVAEGRTNADIAGRIYLSQKTVETYRSRLMKKLGVESLPELMRLVIKRGIIRMD